MIDPAALLAWPFADVEHRYDARDTTIYALGIGLGADPMDRGQLRFVTVDAPDLVAVPSMAVVLARGTSFSADPATGIDRSMVLHGEQGLELLRPLPASGTVVSRSRVTEIVDKGAGKGAVITVETTLADRAGDLARAWQSIFARADGGFGGDPASSRKPHPIPARAPDLSCTLPTASNAALLYRLNGDLNPLHSDPDAARAAGFERPILHGLCTYGVAAHAVLRCFCDYDPARLRGIDVRFSAPVFPGESIDLEFWRDGSEIAFRAHVRARGVTVVDHGLARLTGATDRHG